MEDDAAMKRVVFATVWAYAAWAFVNMGSFFFEMQKLGPVVAVMVFAAIVLPMLVRKANSSDAVASVTRATPSTSTEPYGSQSGPS